MKQRTGIVGFLLGVAVATAEGGIGTVSEQTLWKKGDNGYDTYRIPAIATANNGRLLAFCEGRKNSASDTGNIDVVLRRSDDGGGTWTAQQVVWDDGANTCGNPVPMLIASQGGWFC
jgi:sialidase-1